MRRAGRVMLALVAAAGGEVAAAGAPAAVASAGAQPGAERIEPGLALLAATMAYEAEPFGERLRIYVGPQPWEGRSEAATVRCDPAQRRVRLELGQLEVSLADGQMVAVRRDNPRDVLVRAYQPPLTMAKLAELLPPVPAPGLALALDEDLGALAPYLPIEAWESAQLDAQEGSSLAGVLAGGGQIVVRLERSGRVESVVAQLAEDRWLSIQVSAVAPGDPSQWTIDPAGRRRVDSLADLAPPRLLRAGDAAPALFFVDGDHEPWRLSEAQEQGPVAIVLVRAQREGAIEAGRAAIAALRTRPELSAVLGVVYPMEAWSLERVRRDRAALLEASEPEGAAPEPGPGRAADPPGAAEDGPQRDDGGGQRAPLRALWSVSPVQTQDIAPGEAAVIVVVGAGGETLGVVSLAGRSAAEIAAELESIAGAL